MKLYQQIARSVNARLNCIKSGNKEWEDKHEDRILELVENFMPSGSGIDTGTKIRLSDCTDKRLVFSFSFHHMDNGYYTHWSDHKLIVTPSFEGFDMRITGRDHNDIKDYLYQVFDEVLNQIV